MTIELGRGVIQKRASMELPQITMYTDDPGRYFDPRGHEVSDDVALTAGFDVARQRVERERRRLVAEAEQKARADAEKSLDEIDKRLAEETKTTDWVSWEGEGANRVTKRSPEGEPRETERLEMQHHGRGQWNVIDKADGTVLAVKVPKEDAMNILKEGVPT